MSARFWSKLIHSRDLQHDIRGFLETAFAPYLAHANFVIAIDISGNAQFRFTELEEFLTDETNVPTSSEKSPEFKV